MDRQTLDIAEIGHQGDGIARTADGVVYVPMALPGERVLAEIENGRGKVVEVVTESDERQQPACQHFDQCGACSLQHMAEPAYLSFKRDLVEKALQQHNVQAKVAECIAVAPGTRRRAVFGFRAARDGVYLGFHERLSDQILDIEACPVLHPDLEQLIAAKRSVSSLRRLAALVVRAKTSERMTVHLGENGVSVDLTGRRSQSGPKQAELWEACKPFFRVTLNGETIGEDRGIDTIVSDGNHLFAPPGAFLQATEISEKTLIDLAVPHLKKSRHVADLFCGIGTFTLPLARRASVTAFDGEAMAVQALERSAARAKGIKSVQTARRDLFKFPLSFQELKEIGGVLIDPPRAGAEAQCRQLARSRVARIAYVSCNPQSFARDAKILVDGGFRLSRITPVDQFLWSHHVELVGLFSR